MRGNRRVRSEKQQLVLKYGMTIRHIRGASSLLTQIAHELEVGAERLAGLRSLQKELEELAVHRYQTERGAT